tara:strand:+ start:248 stop:505 length:258 start_codon:yes stop_codon:yes gene_type:complete
MSDYIKKKEKKATPAARGMRQSKLIKIDDLIEKRDGKNILIITPDMFNKDGTMNFAKGGRAMYKSGMRVCKLAKRGKGRAYGKNS